MPGMGRRVLGLVAAAAALAAVDLAVKALVGTEGWAWHQRSPAWAALSAGILGGSLGLVRVPSSIVLAGAAVTSGGVAGNLASALGHGLRVPNPIVAGNVAFNLADVFALAGIALLTTSLSLLAIRNRRLLPGWRKGAGRADCGPPPDPAPAPSKTPQPHESCE